MLALDRQGTTVAIWLGLYLYGDSLSLPFYQDDVAHIRWLSRLNEQSPDPLCYRNWHSGLPAPGRDVIEIVVLAPRVNTIRYGFAFYEHQHAQHECGLGRHSVGVRLDRQSQSDIWTGGLAAIFFGVPCPSLTRLYPGSTSFIYPDKQFTSTVLMVLFYWEGRTSRDPNRPFDFGLIVLCFLSPFEIEYGLMNSRL